MKRRVLLSLLVVFIAGAGVAVWWHWDVLRAHVAPSLPPQFDGPRRPQWASPISGAGLENSYRVAEDLYRGAQPESEGMKRLEEMGVKTVVNLRLLHSDRDELAGTGLEYVHIRVDPAAPSERQLLEFLTVATDANRTPVFVHCNRGIDRTGMMCAIYRIVICGWSKADAIEEMRQGPFGYDGLYKNVPEYLWQLDVEDLKRRFAPSAEGRDPG